MQCIYHIYSPLPHNSSHTFNVPPNFMSFLNNQLNPVSAAQMFLGVGPSTRARLTYQGLYSY